ncbi:MAG: molybdopterin dehydrogenase FAD-binding [Acidimicrobiia bacterium]|nr:molybdopterin dehydrogenase FAD-binding [Acidimicrobiia bacterium]
MKPAPFDYYAPTTVAEAVDLLADLGDEAKVLAGGQSLVPMLNLRLARFEALIDLGRVDALRRVEANGNGLTIGAMVRQCDVDERSDIATMVPLLSAATPLIGHFQIRSRGTVGGSIAHADSAAEYPAVALALDAQLEIAGKSGPRLVDAKDFFLGMWDTVLEPDEILASVHFPSWGPGSGFAVEEVARRHGDFAIAGAAVGVRVSGGTIDRAAIAMFGMGSTPLRATEAEQALVGLSASSIDSEGIGRLAVAGMDPSEDLHASSALRTRIGATVVTRALGRAIQEAGVA